MSATPDKPIQPINEGEWDFYDDEDDEGEELGDFTEADCGRWRNGRLVDQCLLAGSEDCDWECPIGC